MRNASDVLFDQLQDFMQRVMGIMQSRANDLMADLDLTFSQARTVFALACSPEPQPISVVAEQVGISVAAQGRVVDRLVGLEIIERRESPTDRRVKLVSLAPRGFEIADAHGNQKAQAMREVIEGIPTDLCTRLSEALKPILAGDYLRPTTPVKGEPTA